MVGARIKAVRADKDHSFLGALSWQFVPAVIFPTLSSIAVLCLINNWSFVMRTLGSGFDGYGFLVFSLDWTVIGGVGPLFTVSRPHINL
jgi:hypothetical protein